jgi:sulfatase modifying factor 1
VGTATLGAGLWGQLDLSGDVWEWNLDWYAPYADPCTDCADLTASSNRTMRGGDGWNQYSPAVPFRGYDTPTRRFNGPYDNGVGFRCARAPR